MNLKSDKLKLTVIENKRVLIRIGFLYLFMISGGLLQAIGIYENELSKMSSLVLALLSAWLIYEFFTYIRQQSVEDKIRKLYSNRLIIWFILVYIFSVFVENIGVKTGLIFGEYIYGPVLWPFIGYVPAAIGFAWINMLIPSLVLSSMILIKGAGTSRIVLSVMTGLLMVIFDFFLEPAAIELNFWTWASVQVPLQNYLAWFILGALFAWTGLRLGVLDRGYPRYVYHAYFSQLIYFLLILTV